MLLSFVEMIWKYPIGSKVEIEKNSGNCEEIIGYEYYNGKGYLLFRDENKINVEKLSF